MAEQKLRVALIGCGGIGSVHLERWQRIETAELVAVCDAEQERAEKAGVPAYVDHERLLEEVRPDAVDICTPPAFHAPVALAAGERGIPVLCEKPLARNPEEARALVEAARRRGVLLMTAFCHRFHEPIMFVRGLVEDGSLGRVVMFRNRFGAKFAGITERWFSKAEVAGGGVLMDTSIHSIDLFRYLVGEVRRVQSVRRAFIPGIEGVEDSAALLLEADTGAIGVIEASWDTPFSANVVEVDGEGGAAVVDYDTGDVRFRRESDREWKRPEMGAMDRFERELRHFAAAVRGEEAPRVTGDDGLRAIEVIYQAYRE